MCVYVSDVAVTVMLRVDDELSRSTDEKLKEADAAAKAQLEALRADYSRRGAAEKQIVEEERDRVR